MDNLLDTHSVIWFINGDKQLSGKARKTIQDNPLGNFISIASLWEMAIKLSLGKLELKTPFSKMLQQIQLNRFQILPVNFEDTLLISSMAFHHRDPFDRILIAQSINNQLAVISKDPIFKQYGVEIIW